jgi:hypothetical protein
VERQTKKGRRKETGRRGGEGERRKGEKGGGGGKLGYLYSAKLRISP